MADTTNGVPILPNIPISLHPGSLGNIAPALAQEGTPGARALAIAQAALTTSYSAYAKVEEAVGSLPLGDEVRMVNGRPTKLAAGAIDQLVSATEAASGRVLPNVQKGYDELVKIERQLEDQVAVAIDDPARKTPVGLSVASEIRAHVKALSDTKRATFAYAAVEAGDKQTVAALLHAPAYLSGLSDKQMAALRQRAAYAFAPVESTQLEAVRDASNKVAAAGSRLVERFGRVRANGLIGKGYVTQQDQGPVGDGTVTDPLAALWADAYVACHATGPKEETAAELADRLVGEVRTVALERALANLGRGFEARQADIDVFQGNAAANLRYLDARDAAVALHSDELGWEPEPEPEPDEPVNNGGEVA